MDALTKRYLNLLKESCHLQEDDPIDQPWFIKYLLLQLCEGNCIRQIKFHRDWTKEIMTNHLALNTFSYEETVIALENLNLVMEQRQNQNPQRDHIEELKKTKNHLLTKAVLLISYHKNVSPAEIRKLKLSANTLKNDHTFNEMFPNSDARPLYDLESSYNEAIENWDRVRKYEDYNLEYYFSPVRKRGELSHIKPLSMSDYLDITLNCLIDANSPEDDGDLYVEKVLAPLFARNYYRSRSIIHN